MTWSTLPNILRLACKLARICKIPVDLGHLVEPQTEAGPKSARLYTFLSIENIRFGH